MYRGNIAIVVEIEGSQLKEGSWDEKILMLPCLADMYE